MAELKALVKAAGADVVGELTQNAEKPDGKFEIGTGKLQELKELVVTNSDKKMIAKLAIKANIEEVEGYKKTAIENLIGYKF